MKRLFMIFLCFAAVFGLWGCQDGKTPATQEACVKYRLEGMGMEQWIMSAQEIQEQSGIQDLYLKLYEDGTAKIRVDQKPISLLYDDNCFWRPDSPELKMPYVIEGNRLTLTDGAYTYYFEKSV